MWNWIGPLLKQIAQQRLSQQGRMGAIGSGLWQQAEAGQANLPIQAGQTAGQQASGGYLPQGQTPINNIAEGGYLLNNIAAGGNLPRGQMPINNIAGGGSLPGAGQQSFLDAYWKHLLRQWGVR